MSSTGPMPMAEASRAGSCARRQTSPSATPIGSRCRADVRAAWNSGEGAWRQHEAAGRLGARAARVGEPLAVQAVALAARSGRDGVLLGLAAVDLDPLHDLGEPVALGQDRDALDHVAS